MATANIFTDGDFTLATRTGRERISRPFSGEGDNETRIVEVEYVQSAAKFRPNYLDRTIHYNIDLHSEVSEDFPAAYLVEESAVEPLGSTLVKFTRTYAEIPQRRTAFESYAWRRPGAEGGTYGTRKTVTAGTQLGQTTVFTASSHGYSSGDIIVVQLYAIFVGTGASVTLMLKGVATVLTSDTFSLPVFLDDGDYSGIVWQWAIKTGMQREPETIEVASWLEIDYWLPGVTANCDTFHDIPIIPRDVIIDATGGEVDTLSDTTIPTQSAYLTLIGSKTPRVAVASVIRRWRGNIYERTTRYVYTE